MQEPGVRALTWPSAGWMDLELVVVPVVGSLDWLRTKRISLFIGKGKNCSRIAKHFVLEEMSLFENSTRAGGELSLSLWQSWKSSSYLGAQVKLQGLSVSLDFCLRVFRLGGLYFFHSCLFLWQCKDGELYFYCFLVFYFKQEG